MPNITTKQKLVLDFINSFINKNDISPTMEEIRKGLKLKAVSTVHEHIESLKEKGYLKDTENKSRSLILKSETSQIFKIPILGNIAAGQAIEVIEEKDNFISIINYDLKNKKDLYALKVVGDSMIDDGIFDGDIVVIKKQSIAENGQTVVAIINENEATLKRFYKEKNGYKLEPRNQSLLPIFLKDGELEIRGVVIQIISNFNSFKNKIFNTIDLFAGVGGIRLGFEDAGFNTVFANDFESNCKKTYDLNFKRTKLIIEDIRKININDLPKFDFLLGGFPCQAFSIAGYRMGFDDKKDRGNLFFDIAKILEVKKPMGFMLENVKNLKSHDEGKTFKIILETLEKLGYYVKYKVLNTCEYGNIPQNRERVYIVGFREKKYSERFEFPEKIDLKIKISDLLEKEVDKKYYYNDKPLFPRLKNDVKDYGKVYQWRRQYVRENKKGLCPTLTANMGTGGHNVPIIKDNKGIRKLTPLECFRLQGFPKDYKLPNIADSILYKQAGNSVSVSIIERIAKNIYNAILN